MPKWFLLYFAPHLLFLTSATGCQIGRVISPRTASWWNGNEMHRAGMAAFEQRNLEDAEQKLQEAVRLTKNDIDFRRNYAEILWERQKFKESIQQLNEALALGGESSSQLQCSLAEKYLALNQPARAYFHAEEAVRLDDNNAKNWLLKARTGKKLAESAKNTDSPEKFNEYIALARNDYYRAFSMLQEKQSPESQQLLAELAAVQMLCGQPEQALVAWQELRQTYPPGGMPCEFLRSEAETHIALGRFHEAFSCLNEAQQLEPTMPEIPLRLREVQAMLPRQVH